MFVISFANLIVYLLCNNISNAFYKGASDNGFAGLFYILFLFGKYFSIFFVFLFLAIAIILLICWFSKNSSRK